MPTPTPISTRFRPLRALLVAAATALLTVLPPGGGPSPAEAAQVLNRGNDPVTLEINKGAVIRLSRPATTVFVADPDVCDIQMKSPRLVYLLGKKSGNTTLFAVDAQENIIASVDVTVTHDLSRLRDAIRAIHPGAKVNATSIGDAVVLEGSVANPSIAEDSRDFASQVVGKDGRVVNRLALSTQNQVNLRVRIAEISRDVEKQLGIDWTVAGEMFGTNLALSFVNPFVGATVAADSLLFRQKNSGRDVTGLIRALEEEGLVSVLAEPNLTALSGETASFLAGGEFPILVPQDNGNVTVEFKKFGVSLAFTPTVIGENRINLHVRPEVSRLTTDGAVNLPIGTNSVISIPALQVRRAETTIELGSGQSFAIGGLLNNDSSHDVRKVPGLGDVPVLGRLFSSDRFQRNESELVILVTPYLVKPSSTRLATPTDGFAPPNDMERLFPGGTWKRNPVPGTPANVRPNGGLVGPVGYSLD